MSTQRLAALGAYISPGLLQEILAAEVPGLPEVHQARRLPAAVLFADVSGFTPLTEALAQKGQEGPEELTRLLNTYFTRMIGLIEAEGGQVVKFSGDALMVTFPAGDEPLAFAVRRARQAAEAMQAAMAEFATLQTSIGPVALGMKIGLGAGQILTAQLGGLQDHWEYVIAGDPLRQVAQAEHQAGRGDIRLSPEAAAVCHPEPLAPRALTQPDWARAARPEAVEAVLRAFVPTIVTNWLREDLQAWLAVLRPMSVLFIGLGSLDYDRLETLDQLQTFMRAAQEIVGRYEGSINKLAVDDKGTVLIILLGAPPQAHEDDAERAIRCALDLQSTAAAQGLRLAAGVTTGRVFAGPVGCPSRREYTAMGDTVNLAARLMALAGPGETRCDYETYRLARQRLAFESLLPVRVKGKAGLVRLYRPTGESSRAGRELTRVQMVGREVELNRIRELMDQVQAGQSRLLLVEGEAGVGKSRLVEELVSQLRERGWVSLLGSGRSIEQQTPWRAWRDVFETYFAIDEIGDLEEKQRRVRAQLREFTPQLLERLPLLNDVLGLDFPETELTAGLDTQLRNQSLTSLLLSLLRVWTTERPLVLVLEDAHWLDSLSWDFALQTARAFMAGRAPLLLTVVMRPLEGDRPAPQYQALAALEQAVRLTLDSLAPDEARALASLRLGVPPTRLPSEVAELVQARTNGNPFFVEELIHFLVDNGLVAVEAGPDGETRCRVIGDLGRAAGALPDTIQGLVLSRIDRLAPEEQLTLKVAAVIGRTFRYVLLQDTLGTQMGLKSTVLQSQLTELADMELTPLEAREPELTYVFKHIITQETAYQTLLFAQRRQLHRAVAEWYERKLGGPAALGERGAKAALAADSPQAQYFPLLAYHWREAEDAERERGYARLAGEWAAARFANVEAVTYLTRALALTPQTDRLERYELLLAREAVNDLRGEREAQRPDLEALTALAQAMGDRRRLGEATLRRANYAETLSDYAAYLQAARQAAALADELQDPSLQAQTRIAIGRAQWRLSDYATAAETLTEARALARAAGDRYTEAASLYALGNAYLYQNNYAAAREHHQQALAIRQATGQRQGEADSLNTLGHIGYELGDYPNALEYFEQVLIIFRTIGDRRGEGIVLNNLGIAACDLGDYDGARNYHELALDIRLAIGDRYGQANCYANLALVQHELGQNHLADQYAGRALDIFRDIGDRRGEAYSLTYLGHALAGMQHWEAARAAYQQAADIRRQVGQPSLAMDDLAGLARVALGQGDRADAEAHAAEVRDWIAANGLEGMEYPLQVCLTVYRVLSPIQPAAPLLERAHALLLERAGRISREDQRRLFLENVATNRELRQAWAELHLS